MKPNMKQSQTYMRNAANDIRYFKSGGKRWIIQQMTLGQMGCHLEIQI